MGNVSTWMRSWQGSIWGDGIFGGLGLQPQTLSHVLALDVPSFNFGHQRCLARAQGPRKRRRHHRPSGELGNRSFALYSPQQSTGPLPSRRTPVRGNTARSTRELGVVLNCHGRQHSPEGYSLFSTNVALPPCSQAVRNQCGPVLNESERKLPLILNQCDSKPGLVLNPKPRCFQLITPTDLSRCQAASTGENAGSISCRNSTRQTIVIVWSGSDRLMAVSDQV